MAALIGSATGGPTINYYNFHIGDYAAHTGHLEPFEDLAYRRMLDLYYRTEKALPTDWREVARLIRMRDQGEVIESVLSEFFSLADDGWHSKRADAELTAMLTKQEERATKDEHESERMRRFRQRRAEMFAALREVGVVPAWDLAMKDLQRLYDENCNAPATLPETDLQRTCNANDAVSCNALATAIPTPTPIPTPSIKDSSRASRLPSNWTLPDEWAAWASEQRPDLSPAETAEQFRDYWIAKSGKDGTKLDWQATWRNWVKNQRQGPRATAVRPPTAAEQRMMQAVSPSLLAPHLRAQLVQQPTQLVEVIDVAPRRLG